MVVGMARVGSARAPATMRAAARSPSLGDPDTTAAERKGHAQWSNQPLLKMGSRDKARLGCPRQGQPCVSAHEEPLRGGRTRRPVAVQGEAADIRLGERAGEVIASEAPDVAVYHEDARLERGEEKSDAEM